MRITASNGTTYEISRDTYQYILQEVVVAKHGAAKDRPRLLKPRFYPNTDALFRAVADEELKSLVHQLETCVDLRDSYAQRLSRVYETADTKHDSVNFHGNGSK